MTCYINELCNMVKKNSLKEKRKRIAEREEEKDECTYDQPRKVVLLMVEM